jgi:TRAP-type C4-dicarboxylate transport system substrate-binding protein
LNIQVISGPTLANAANVWERTVSGVTEIGFGIHGAVGLPFPKTTVTSVPFVVQDLTAGSTGLWRLYEKGLIAMSTRM